MSRLILFICFFIFSSYSYSDSVNQSSSGDKSPVINSQGDVNVVYNDDKTKQSIYEILTSLDKVEHLLPIDINLQECLESKREELLAIKEIPERIHAEGRNYSRCLLHMKQEFKSPEWMIRQHFPLLAEFSEKNEKIPKLVGEIIFKINEMQNNQHSHEIWLVLGCTNEVKYVNNLNMDKYEGNCISAIEDFDKYKDRINRRVSGEIEQIPNDILAQVGRTRLEDVDYRVSIVPKDQDIPEGSVVTGYDTMIEQTVSLNEHVFSNMADELAELKMILLGFVEK